MNIFRQFSILFVFCLFSASASANCGSWVKRAVRAATKPAQPLFMKSVSLEEMGREKFFQKRKGKIKPQLHLLEIYIRTHPDVILPIGLKSDFYELIDTYRRVIPQNRFLFNPNKAAELLKMNIDEIRVSDIFKYLKAHTEDVRSHLEGVKIHVPRAPVRVVAKYKWIIIGTTLFTLWDPVQAEIRSRVYWAFNAVSSLVLGQAPNTPSRYTRMGDLPELIQLNEPVKNKLRALYFETNDRYPYTTQSSRNNFAYVSDYVQKRDDEMAAALERGDHAAVQQRLFSLYLIPLVFDEIIMEPLGGFIVDDLNKSYNTFDPDRIYLEDFLEKLKRYLDGDLPSLELRRP